MRNRVSGAATLPEIMFGYFKTGEMTASQTQQGYSLLHGD